MSYWKSVKHCKCEINNIAIKNLNKGESLSIAIVQYLCIYILSIVIVELSISMRHTVWQFILWMLIELGIRGIYESKRVPY